MKKKSMISFITIVRNIENPFLIFQAEIKVFQIIKEKTL
jgi:hypothetical protein